MVVRFVRYGVRRGQVVNDTQGTRVTRSPGLAAVAVAGEAKVEDHSVVSGDTRTVGG